MKYCSEKFCKIYRIPLVPGSLINKVAAQKSFLSPKSKNVFDVFTQSTVASTIMEKISVDFFTF